MNWGVGDIVKPIVAPYHHHSLSLAAAFLNLIRVGVNLFPV